MTLRQASIVMILAAAMWGTNPALVKLADWHPIATAWLRGGFCGAFVLGYLVFSGRYSRLSFALQFLCGLSLAINSLLFVAASSYTSPANAVVLMFIFPWITIALDYFVKHERPRTSDLVRLIIGLCGITLIVGGGVSEGISAGVIDGENAEGNDGIFSPNVIGDIFAICAGIAIALHIFFSQKLAQIHGGNNQILSAIALAWGITFIGLLPFVTYSLSLGTVSLETVILETPILFPTNEQWPYLIAFGVLSALPWLLWGKAIAHISGHVVAALLGVEVFTAALLGWWVLDITPSWATWIGGLLILTAAGHQIVFGGTSNDE